MPKDDIWKNKSMEDTKFGIGQLANGEFDIFPASQLKERMDKDRMQAEATDHAIRTVYPDDDHDAVIGV